MDVVDRLSFYSLVIFHHIAVFGFIISTPLIIIYEPLWLSLPVVTWIFYLIFGKLECPLTVWENILRRKLKKPKIKTFVKHYYLDRWRRK